VCDPDIAFQLPVTRPLKFADLIKTVKEVPAVPLTTFAVLVLSFLFVKVPTDEYPS